MKLRKYAFTCLNDSTDLAGEPMKEGQTLWEPPVIITISFLFFFLCTSVVQLE